MKKRIYKSLDKSSSLFGLRGTYLTWGIMGIGAALCIAFMIGSVTSGLIGTICFVIFGVVAYLFVIYYQSKYSERERDKWLSAKKLPDIIVLSPRPINKMSNYKLKYTQNKPNQQNQ